MRWCLRFVSSVGSQLVSSVDTTAPHLHLAEVLLSWRYYYFAFVIVFAIL